MEDDSIEQAGLMLLVLDIEVLDQPEDLAFLTVDPPVLLLERALDAAQLKGCKPHSNPMSELGLISTSKSKSCKDLIAECLAGTGAEAADSDAPSTGALQGALHFPSPHDVMCTWCTTAHNT